MKIDMRTTDTTELSVAELREQLAETLNEVRYTKARRLVTKHGRKVAALVSVEDLQLLETLEDVVDLKLVHERLANLETEGTVSWEDALHELGVDKDELRNKDDTRCASSIMKTDITHGSAFLALGFAEPEASNLQTRPELMIEIQSIIGTEGLTQKEAADRFGTSQPRISALLKGRIDKFTVDALMNMLSHAGRPVAVVTKDKILALPATTTRRKVMNAIFPRNRR